MVRRPEAVCGFLNAKNAYGGYAGRVRFAWVIKSGEIFIEVPIGTVTRFNIKEYDTADEALKRYCPGIRSPFLKD